MERDFMLSGLIAELADRDLKVDYRSVCNFVHAENLRRKKPCWPSEKDRHDVARRREQWVR
jgi:transposase